MTYEWMFECPDCKGTGDDCQSCYPYQGFEEPGCPPDYQVFFTSAPKSYDRGTTRDLGMTSVFMVNFDGTKTQMRAIAIPEGDTRLIDDQVGRNSSGLHPTWDEAALREHLEYKTAVALHPTRAAR